MVDALREYADEWRSGLQDAPNHHGHRDLVEQISRNSDEQLSAWLLTSSA